MPRELKTWTRVKAFDEVEGRGMVGTVVSGTEKPGPVNIMWDCEEYDGGSLGHEAPDDMLHELEVLEGARVPLLHRMHPLVGVYS